jgi:hypothetical protein
MRGLHIDRAEAGGRGDRCGIERESLIVGIKDGREERSMLQTVTKPSLSHIFELSPTVAAC